MIRKSLKWLLIIVAFSSLLLLATVLPLEAASGPPRVVCQGEDEVQLDLLQPTITVRGREPSVVEIVVRNGRPLRILEVRLEATIPSESLFTSLNPPSWGRIASGASQRSVLNIVSPTDLTQTLTGTITLEYRDQDNLGSTNAESTTLVLIPPKIASVQPSPEVTKTEETPQAGEEPTEEPATATPEPAPEETEEEPSPEPSPTATATPGFLGGLWENLRAQPGTLTLTIVLVLVALLALLLVIVLLFRLFRKPKGKGKTQPLKPTPPPSARTGGPVRPYLVLTDTRGKVQRVPLGGEGLTIGRDTGNDLVIDKQVPRWETVSRNHARIYSRGGYWVFEDLDSRNGIYVDGQRTGKNLLEDGRKLGIGGVTLTFHTSSGEVSS